MIGTQGFQVQSVTQVVLPLEAHDQEKAMMLAVPVTIWSSWQMMSLLASTLWSCYWAIVDTEHLAIDRQVAVWPALPLTGVF